MKASREKILWPLLEWRALYSSGFPLNPADRPAWLASLLTVEGLPERGHANWIPAIRLYRKLRADERLKWCAKFFAARTHLDVYTVLYRHGGQLAALRQEAPSADDAAYAVSAAVGHKCAIIAVVPGLVDFASGGDLPKIFCFWHMPMARPLFAWRPGRENRTRRIKGLT